MDRAPVCEQRDRGRSSAAFVHSAPRRPDASPRGLLLRHFFVSLRAGIRLALCRTSRSRPATEEEVRAEAESRIVALKVSARHRGREESYREQKRGARKSVRKKHLARPSRTCAHVYNAFI